MKTTLIYNNFIKEIEIDPSIRIGVLQEMILNTCLLIIYNIEHSSIRFEEKEYSMGEDGFLFEYTIQDILNSYHQTEISQVIIYDRKRDEQNNVIKENKIIDRYIQWYQQYENEMYIHSLHSSLDQSLGRSLDQSIQSLLDSSFIVSSLERLPSAQLIPNMLNQVNTNNIHTEINSNQFTESILQNAIQTVFDDTLYRRDISPNEENVSLNEEQDSLNNHSSTEIEEQQTINTDASTQRNQLNNIIFMLDSYLRNREEQRMDEFHSTLLHSNIITDFNNVFRTISDENSSYLWNDLPPLIPITEIDLPVQQKDVQIVLTPNDFEKLETFCYDKTDMHKENECLICMEYFQEKEILTQLTCQHIFHKTCIQEWLCEESHKCPICRIEMENGIPKNI